MATGLAQQDIALAERVVVAMSGGVDSSVVAALLAERGEDVVGISMRLYETAPDSPKRGCCSPDDLFDARSVAATLDIPFYVVNYQREFEERVIEQFVQEYRRGRTPSPCVLCNSHVKFDTLLERALQVGAETLATGHYAIIDRAADGRWRLRRGIDPGKDQSYFLFGIRRADLPRIRFPLGGLTKLEVRGLAERFGLPTAAKAESQDLCFVGGGHYLAFLEQRLADGPPAPGDIVHVQTGEVLGQHGGVHRYTVGQRRGLNIGGGEPLYVVGLDAARARVLVGPSEALGTRSCTIERCNWVAFARLDAPLDGVSVQIRYRHRPVRARVEPLPGERARVTFEQPEAAVSPGQALVVYSDDEVLGGGWIDERA